MLVSYVWGFSYVWGLGILTLGGYSYVWVTFGLVFLCLGVRDSYVGG